MNLLKPKIGLTGLIGSGKSVVSAHFAKLGAYIIDTDVIAHNLTSNNGLAIPLIIDAFGSEFIIQNDNNQALDRIKMRKLIFENQEMRTQLENILHPLIFEETLNQLKLSNQTQCSYIVIVVPLLFKSPNYLNLIDRILVVKCEKEILIKRVMQRSNLSPDEVIKIINAQTRLDEQLKNAHDILYNNGCLEELFNQIEKLDKKYKNLYSDIKNN